MKLVFIVFALVAGQCFATPKKATAKCSELCVSLKIIAEDYKKEALKDQPDFDRLQIKSGDQIEDAKSKSPKMSPDEVQAYVEVMRLSIPVDPGRIMLERNIAVLNANRGEIEALVRALGKTESADLLEAIKIAVLADSSGPDSAPKK